jgi:Uncharacterized protein conserved in archaea|nr:MAG: OB-fold nucleic acid binding domain family protein [Candidatus Nanosalinarum sp. J07AB56]
MPPQQERQTAKLVTAEEIHSGRYFEKEGFTPNYLLTPEGRRISRARTVGTVVDTFTNDDETYGSLTVDDGTDTVQLKFFSDLGPMDGFSDGDVVEAVGKVREYQGQVYLNAEVLVHRDPEDEMSHLLKHRRQLIEFQGFRDTVEQMHESGKSRGDIENEMAGRLGDDEVDAVLQSLNEDFGDGSEERENLEREVISAVEDLDDGEGADYSDIMEEVDGTEDELESAVNTLLSEGTFYEPQPGKIKKL